jgi:anaerobic magnesium-protoporphyrin IX monomethyl ester cyclase
LRVLLINPPYPVCEGLTMPLGLLYLAARLEEAGHRVEVADLQLCRAPIFRLKEAIRRLDPMVVGITSFSINLSKASRMLRTAKRCSEEIFTLWGGPHASFDDAGILNRHPWVDAVARGEGEETLLELVDALERGDSLERVRGVTWRRPDGSLRRNEDRAFRPDLESLPRPAWHLLELSKYRAFGEGASIITSRGCPHRCLFCVGRRMVGAKGRFRTPKAVVDEMEALCRLGFQHVRVEDDLFTLRRDRALSICREVERRGLSVRWRAYSRVDTVDPELLACMRRAGCERLLFGAESGNPQILRRIGKGITPEQTRRAVAMCKEAGIGVLASFVLGLPGETPDTLRMTLEFAESLGVPYTLNLLTPYMGTAVRDRASELGIEILSDEWALYGQGKPVAATASVRPWHLSRALASYRRGLEAYAEGLLEDERRGTLTEKGAEELERHRRLAFLRRLIGEDLLERHPPLPLMPEMQALERLSRSLAAIMGQAREEIEPYLESLATQGHIKLSKEAGAMRWMWTRS